MGKRIKHHIGGIIILVAVFLMFWPIFSRSPEPHAQYMTFSSQTQLATLPNPIDELLSQDQADFNELLGGEDLQYKPQPQGVKTWVIQLASFSEVDNATHFVTVLRAQGYQAYLVTVFNELEQRVTRVLVGPETDYKRAKILIASLQEDFNLEGMILPYNPFVRAQ